jgi:hypothetical protein
MPEVGCNLRYDNMQLIRHYILKGLITFIAGALLYACSDCEPLDDPGNTLIITFYNWENFEADETLVAQPVDLDSFQIASVKYPLISISTNSYGVSIPQGVEQLSLQIHYPDTLIKEYDLAGEIINDTLLNVTPDELRISYSNSFEPVSPDCGIITRFENIGIDNTSFNRAEVKFDFIEANDSTNINIFF